MMRVMAWLMVSSMFFFSSSLHLKTDCRYCRAGPRLSRTSQLPKHRPAAAAAAALRVCQSCPPCRAYSAWHSSASIGMTVWCCAAAWLWLPTPLRPKVVPTAIRAKAWGCSWQRRDCAHAQKHHAWVCSVDCSLMVLFSPCRIEFAVLKPVCLAVQPTSETLLSRSLPARST